MPLLSYTLPTLGNSNVSEAPLVRSALSAYKTEYNTNIPAPGSGGVGILGQETTIAHCNTGLFATNPATTYGIVDCQFAIQVPWGNFIGGPMPIVMYLAAADYAITGYTTKIALNCRFMSNAATPPNVTIGLYPLTSPTGSLGQLTMTLGSVVVSQAFNSQGGNATRVGFSPDVDFPADGVYVLAVVTSGVIPTNGGIHVGADLVVRNV